MKFFLGLELSKVTVVLLLHRRLQLYVIKVIRLNEQRKNLWCQTTSHELLCICAVNLFIGFLWGMFAYLSSLIIFCYSHGPCSLCTSRTLLSTIYSSVPGKHGGKQTLWKITIYRTYRVTNCVTLVPRSLLSDKTASVNSRIFHSSFIVQGKNDWKRY